MSLISSIRAADPSVLVLSLAWKVSSAHPSTIAVSLSNGQIGVFDSQIPEDPVRYIQAHSLEAWTATWSAPTDTAALPSLYSGGDDSAFCEHRERPILSGQQSDDDSLTQNLWETLCSDMRTHSAGVTAILYLTKDPSLGFDVILTGSYDEHIRVLAHGASRRRPKVLVEKRLGGGVWRLKLLKSNSDGVRGTYMILASCMYAGPKILEIDRSAEDIWTINIQAQFGQHESMNYASDSQEQMLLNGVQSMIYISTSFYDRKLCVWRVSND